MSKTALEYAEQAQELCVLSDVYVKVNQMLMSDDCSMAKLADAIAYEPAIAASLLKMANSAMFSMPKQVDSLSKALVLLGLSKVKNLVSAYGVTAAFSDIDPKVADMDKFWEISVDCALICQYLANEKHLPNTDGIFLSGLFHNLGMLAIIHSAPDKVKYCEAYDSDETPWERQQDVFGYTFADCSAQLLTLWNLPSQIIEPIAQVNLEEISQSSSNAKLLYIASRLAVINAEPGIYHLDLIDSSILDDLDISGEDLKESLAYCNQQAMELLAAFPIQTSR